MSQPKNYTALVVQLKQEIQTARIKASLNANAHLLTLYWKMGKAILENQDAEGWGTKVGSAEKVYSFSIVKKISQLFYYWRYSYESKIHLPYSAEVWLLKGIKISFRIVLRGSL